MPGNGERLAIAGLALVAGGLVLLPGPLAGIGWLFVLLGGLVLLAGVVWHE